jgi:hypothetical protein
LFSAGFADGGNEKAFHAHPRVEHFLFGEARVDYIDDAVDSDTGLGNVGGYDDLASSYTFFIWFGCVLENSLLLVWRKRAV